MMSHGHLLKLIDFTIMCCALEWAIMLDLRTVMKKMLDVLLIAHLLIWVLVMTVLTTLEDELVELFLHVLWDWDTSEVFLAAEWAVDRW